MEQSKKIKRQDCPHLAGMRIMSSNKTACEVCGEGQHLRLCTSCGGVYCCESHKAHDREHFKNTGHSIIVPMHTSYDFTWCYECNAYLE